MCIMYRFPAIQNINMSKPRLHSRSGQMWRCHWGLQNLSDLEFDLSGSLNHKCHGTAGLPIYGFILYLIVTYGLILLFYQIWLWNRSDLEFDLSKSLKVKRYGATGLLMYGFLLIFYYSNIWPTLIPFWLLVSYWLLLVRYASTGVLDEIYIRLQNLSAFEFDLQGHPMRNLMVPLNFPYVVFTLMFNSNIGHTPYIS